MGEICRETSLVGEGGGGEGGCADDGESVRATASGMPPRTLLTSAILRFCDPGVVAIAKPAESCDEVKCLNPDAKVLKRTGQDEAQRDPRPHNDKKGRPDASSSSPRYRHRSAIDEISSEARF